LTAEQKLMLDPNLRTNMENKWNYSVHGLEPYSRVSKRCIRALRKLRTDSVVISHGETIINFQGLFECPFGTTLDKHINLGNLPNIQNGQVCEYDFTDPSNIIKRISNINKDLSGYEIGDWQIARQN
jgi:broad specificity phosphatase PhoE